ncbi:hypothetical protein [Nonomuraea endophytica]|uniref:Uncharacterized protein n=1 Tax=Nonomuraea endophytica TaxID=714136 RepID=A0A7W8A829_9ACTN|nr:hypothetical protein [Nonomuraea endophytica]MBB5081352.1 hypothetical protein [Nonomuraea endophytica]
MNEIQPQRGTLVPTPEEWQPGDVVLDNQGSLFARASAHDEAKGWPWGYTSTAARGFDGEAYVPEGSVEEGYPTRPLRLLVRDGRTVASPDTKAQPYRAFDGVTTTDLILLDQLLRADETGLTKAAGLAGRIREELARRPAHDKEAALREVSDMAVRFIGTGVWPLMNESGE